MQPCPTYDDVNLILRLYELRREPKMRQAREWFAKSFQVKTMEEFQQLCPPGSETNAYYRMIVSYWEMVASFITSGVLHQDLFFQNGRELLFVWERIRDFLPEWREGSKDPKSYGNLEIVANNYIEWLNKRGPQAYQAFAERVRGPKT